MKTRSTDGVSINYQVAGKGKPALVFVHGFCCDSSYWDSQVPFFSRNYTCVTIDLAGHGESGTDRKRWTSAALGDDVVAVIKDLDLKKVILIGHSMGGGVIAEAYWKIPERIIGLVGVDSFLDVEQPNWTSEMAKEYLRGLDTDPQETMRQHILTMFVPNSDPVLVKHILEDMSDSPIEVTRGLVRDRSGYDRLIGEAFKDITVPVYSIVSDMNTIDIATTRRYHPTFEAIYMSGVGHFPMMENPETFNELLSEVIGKLDNSVTSSQVKTF